MVEMGIDRMHHAFWKHLDADGPYADAILDYHRHVDELVGSLLEHADEDTAVLVVSDHGAKRMEGGIRVNEWLRREGYLRTLTEPDAPVPLADARVDWGSTRAWGDGGYYGRISLTVRGREPEGTVAPED